MKEICINIWDDYLDGQGTFAYVESETNDDEIEKHALSALMAYLPVEILDKSNLNFNSHSVPGIYCYSRWEITFNITHEELDKILDKILLVENTLSKIGFKHNEQEYYLTVYSES
ncbi:hypothetical protein ZPAH1_orf00103 [Aeromonas phage ZPAH1]|nr:hypothetical protein ZPAH1_orf00103 [Aeromonas phage ZPAH1]